MKMKSLILAGMVTMTAVSALSLDHGRAWAQGQPQIVLAQNEAKQSFWGKLFNKKDQASDTKPVYLDQKNNPSSYPTKSVKVTPYQQNNSSYQEKRDVSAAQAKALKEWEEFEAKNRAYAQQVSDYADQQAQKQIAMVEQQAELLRQKGEEMKGNSAASSTTSIKASSKKQVQDPSNVWKYKSNSRSSSSQSNDEKPKSSGGTRLYNVQ